MLFPAPATKGENNHQSRVENNGRATTDVSRESTEGNLVETLSIARMYRPEGTTLRSLRGAIRRRCCGSSTGQEERANSVTYHLPNNLSISGWQREEFDITNISICSCHLPLAESFLSLDETRYQLIGIS
jgi:hypothetical protein